MLIRMNDQYWCDHSLVSEIVKINGKFRAFFFTGGDCAVTESQSEAERIVREVNAASLASRAGCSDGKK